MAGMDYEQLTFNKEGKVHEVYPFNHKAGDELPPPNYPTFSTGLMVEPYKNWLYLKHPAVWKALDPNNSFIEPTIAKFGEGQFDFAGVQLCAKRIGSNQNRMLWFATRGYGPEKEIFSGVAAYGHLNDTKFYVEQAGHKYEGKEWSSSSTNFYKGKEVKDKNGKPSWVRTVEEMINDTELDLLTAAKTQEEKNKIFKKRKRIQFKVKREVETWVGVTKFDMIQLVKFLNENYEKEHAKLVQKHINKVPELDVTSHFEGRPALFTMMFGRKPKHLKETDIRRYL